MSSTTASTTTAATQDSVEQLHQELGRLRKINKVLMERVERGLDLSGDGYSLFQAATVLEQKVNERTQALASAKESLEESNRELIAAKEAAEAAVKTKDAFLASMSHELRTPLNAILGASESLIEGIYGPVNEDQRQSLRIVESSGSHLLALINDILDMARIGAGELQLQHERVLARPVAQASLNIVSGAAEKRGVLITLADSEHGDLGLIADERRLKQILVNLLGNAIKFTDPGGSVTLAVVREPERGWVQFVVADTGVGIAEDSIKDLFKPFVQVDSSLARRFEGTGLGLSLVANMTELNGGEVSVTSTPGVGSTFTVSFPSVNAEGIKPTLDRLELDEVATVGPRPGSTKSTVLLVEDNQANIDVIAPYLEAKGYRMLIATGGAQAIEMARRYAPDMILMDIQMPEVNGLEAIASIRKQDKGSRVPIIALTALAMPGDRERCMAAGANDHVTKPVRLRALDQVMTRMLSQRLPPSIA